MRWRSAGIAVAVVWPAAVWAQGEELPDRFALKLGAFYLHDSDTEFSARSGTGLLGTSINFESDLDGEDSVTGPLIRGYYRFNPRHRVDFGWYRVERDGSRRTSREITFGDTTFPVDVGVDSSIDTEVAKLLYTWSFYHVEKVELAASIGAQVMSYDFRLSNPRRTLVETKSVSQPLPVFGFRMDYTINPRWHLLFDVETFYIEFQDKLRGSLDDIQLSLECRPWRHVSFGASLDRLAINANVDETDYRGSVNDLYRGGQLYIGLHY